MREFQFHIVRLKDGMPHRTRHYMPFQFHIVRLKGLQELPSSDGDSLFQFHIVRLKGLIFVHNYKK